MITVHIVWINISSDYKQAAAYHWAASAVHPEGKGKCKGIRRQLIQNALQYKMLMEVHHLRQGME